jgi:TatD DNase family protein
MQLVDTHAHLDDEQFNVDRASVVRSAVEAGVTLIITVGADLASSRSAVSLAEWSANIYATVGVHPHDASSMEWSALDELRDLAARPDVVAIGEIGLDYYRDLSPRDVQRSAFEAQLELATAAGKPVVVHIRDSAGEDGAYSDALAILRDWITSPPRSARLNNLTSEPSSPGVLHCFSGPLPIARDALDLGFYLGTDGPVTYPSANALRSVVAQLPLERLLLETDCPYLAPQLRRGRRNEPSYLPFIAQEVAGLQHTSLCKVAEVTTANAVRLFRLPGWLGEE